MFSSAGLVIVVCFSLLSWGCGGSSNCSGYGGRGMVAVVLVLVAGCVVVIVLVMVVLIFFYICCGGRRGKIVLP